jgi:hypothetical protein
LKEFDRELTSYLSHGVEGIVGTPEDVFFAAISQMSQFYSVPDPLTASLFATENPPSSFLKYNGGRIPMGGHAWWKFDYKFWFDLINE